MDNEKIQELKAKVESDPKSKLFVPLADEYRKSGMLDKAIEVLKKGLELQPKYTSAVVALGKIYFEKEMFAEARGEFENVITHVPDNLFAQRKLADVYRKLGERDLAIEQYRRALKLNPMDEEAQSILEELSKAPAKAPVVPEEEAEEISTEDEDFLLSLGEDGLAETDEEFAVAEELTPLEDVDESEAEFLEAFEAEAAPVDEVLETVEEAEEAEFLEAVEEAEPAEDVGEVIEEAEFLEAVAEVESVEEPIEVVEEETEAVVDAYAAEEELLEAEAEETTEVMGAEAPSVEEIEAVEEVYAAEEEVLEAEAEELAMEMEAEAAPVIDEAEAYEVEEAVAAEDVADAAEEAYAIEEDVFEAEAEELAMEMEAEAAPVIDEAEAYEVEEAVAAEESMEEVEAVEAVEEDALVMETAEDLVEEAGASDETSFQDIGSIGWEETGNEQRLAQEYISKGQYSKALNIYKQILKHDPQNVVAKQGLQELEALIKLIGSEKEVIIARLEALLGAIKKRKNELYRIA